MKYSKVLLRKIYDRTSGYCHLCGKKISFKNYGKLETHSPWEVEHSIPKSNGGNDHLNNLYAACISCNRKKGNKHNRIIRNKKGLTKAPLSIRARKKARMQNAVKNGIVGGMIGVLFGPWGIMTGAAIGTSLGYDKNPDSE